MMNIRSFAVAATLTACAGLSQATLVTNGGFESGMTGWSASTPAGSFGAGTQASPAYEGSSYFWGYDNASGGTVSQLLTTDAGGTYFISFAFNTNGTVPPNKLSVSVGDLSVDPLSLVEGTWSTYSGTFKASSASTLLSFGFRTVSGTGTVWIDAVDVERIGTVPVPGTALLVGLGLACLGASRRARR